MLSFELTKDTPYLAFSGELWSVFYEYFNRNWPCYKGFLLYIKYQTTVSIYQVQSSPFITLHLHLIQCTLDISYYLSYGVSIIRILMKTDCVITSLHCIWPRYIKSLYTTSDTPQLPCDSKISGVCRELNQYHPGLILGLGPANERWRYNVTPSLIGWAQS